MKLGNISIVLAMIATGSSAATLPLKRGEYVLVTVPCKDPPLAAMFTFDGQHFSYPHASDCHSDVRPSGHHSYHVSTTCSTLGDGSPAAATTEVARYTVQSATRVIIRNRSERSDLHYRWCSAPKS
jgi:hypothetical protein